MPTDLIIIGAGPAGYVAAERAGAAGKSVLLIERENVLGGVCLNWGCIPTKTLLACSKIYYQAKHGASFGVSAPGLRFDWAAAQERKRKVVAGLNQGVVGLMKKAKAEIVRGAAKLVAKDTVEVGGKTYQAKDILICTGSRPAKPPIPGIDLPHVVDSTGMLDLAALPQRLVVVGGGVIGLEFACLAASVDVPVTVIEMMSEVLPGMDAEIARTARLELEKKGITFHLGAKVTRITSAAIEFTDAKGATQQAPADRVLVATGRLPNVEGLGLEAIGVAVEKRRIVIDERCRTNVPGIWAAGDCTGKSLLAHTASRQGEVAVANLCGHDEVMRYGAIPGVVYTSPEVASVGLTEAEAKEKGIPHQVVKLPMAVSGRFLAENDGRGLVKAILHKDTRALLGLHLVGGTCSEMVFGACAMIEAETRVDEIAEVIFPHPTVCEVIREAMIAAQH